MPSKPVRSHTRKVDDHLSIDKVIEDNAAALEGQEYIYLAGPVIHEDGDGQVYVTMLYAPGPDALRTSRDW